MSDYNTQDAMNEAKDSLSNSARTLASHAEELLNSTTSMSSDSIAAIRDKLTESLRSVREQISSAQTYAMDRGKEAFSVTDSYVRGKPWQAVAVAALAGVFLGLLSGGSRRR